MSVNQLDTTAHTANTTSTQNQNAGQNVDSISDRMARQHAEARAAEAAEKNPFGERSFFKASVHETINETTRKLAQKRINGESGPGMVVSSVV